LCSGTKLVEQLEWHWDNQMRRRLDGLTDEEYFWEPVPGWSVRPARSPSQRQDPGYIQVGAGDFLIDFAWPEPQPAPVTTIAWRLGHIVVGMLSLRIASHFGGAPHDYRTYDYPTNAKEALRRLDVLHDQRVAGIWSWSDGTCRCPSVIWSPGSKRSRGRRWCCTSTGN
jgi:hypothetical protein